MEGGKYHIIGGKRRCLDCGKVLTDGGLYWCMTCFSKRYTAWVKLPSVWFHAQGGGIVHVNKPTADARWN